MLESTAEIQLTPEGYDAKVKELEEARHFLHETIPERLKVAKEHGGELRENKEFIDIQTEKEFYETKVRQLEALLDRATVIDPKSISTKEVGIGTWVTLKTSKSKGDVTFEVVSQAEVDLEGNKVSMDSPLGSALMGRKKGDDVEIETPLGMMKYTIMAIKKG
jgi:transcription elongation factor GreA